MKPPLWNTPRGYHKLRIGPCSLTEQSDKCGARTPKEENWIFEAPQSTFVSSVFWRSGNPLPVLEFNRVAKRSARVTNIFEREFRNLSLVAGVFCKTIRKSN